MHEVWGNLRQDPADGPWPESEQPELEPAEIEALEGEIREEVPGGCAATSVPGAGSMELPEVNRD